MPSSTGKKGSKKAGRGKRSPAHTRYNNEHRDITNKKKRAAKVTKAIAHGKVRAERKKGKLFTDIPQVTLS